jgi:hypothetical protein
MLCDWVDLCLQNAFAALTVTLPKVTKCFIIYNISFYYPHYDHLCTILNKLLLRVGILLENNKGMCVHYLFLTFI